MGFKNLNDGALATIGEGKGEELNAAPAIYALQLLTTYPFLEASENGLRCYSCCCYLFGNPLLFSVSFVNLHPLFLTRLTEERNARIKLCKRSD